MMIFQVKLALDTFAVGQITERPTFNQLLLLFSLMVSHSEEKIWKIMQQN
jgi:hypothetical protein